MDLAARLNSIYNDNITAFERDYPDLANHIRKSVLTHLEYDAKYHRHSIINVESVASSACTVMKPDSGAYTNARAYVKHVCKSFEGGGVYVAGPNAGSVNITVAWPDAPVPKFGFGGVAAMNGASDPTGRGARARETLDSIVNDILHTIPEVELRVGAGLPENWRDDPETEARVLVRAVLRAYRPS
jgi:hypothetical protein